MAKMELLASDFVFDEQKNEWIALMDFAPISQALQNMKPSSKPTVASPAKADAVILQHSNFEVEAVKSFSIQRRFPRFLYMNDVMVHDDHSVFMGQTFQGSEGGTGLVIENATLATGQNLKIHFSSHDGMKAFNAECEIVSKRVGTDVRSRRSPVPYCVKFLKVDSKVQMQLRDYFLNKKAV
jgi:hypothetical protein